MKTMFAALLACYSLGIEAVVWLALVPLHALRVFAGTHEWRELRQRLGTGPDPQRSGAVGRLMLVHAVSAGEMMAAEPVVARLAPSPVLLTTHTAAGMAVARLIQTAHPHVDACVFLPWDRRAIRRWLRARRIAAVFVLETEIWPNLFSACGALDVPLFIANGRLHDRERAAYRLARPFFRRVLHCATWIGVQTDRDRHRFVSIGAPEHRVHVTGNLKQDAGRVAPQLPPGLAATIAEQGVIVAGSTHDPEETLLLTCLEQLRRERPVQAIIAPRDVARSRELCRLAAAASLRPVCLSDFQRASSECPHGWDVLIVDEYGWLPAFYETADVALVGGTFTAVGGHSVIEPASRGRPVIVGPHVDGIDSIMKKLTASGGVVQLQSTTELLPALTRLLSDPSYARAIGNAARETCRREAGAADRSWAGIAAHLSHAAAS